MYFRKCSLHKTLLDNCLKEPLSEDRLINNMLNGPKQC